jgi:hypothetical protein
MNPLYGLILVFVNSTTQQQSVSGIIQLFPDKAICEAKLTTAVAYQHGVHATDGWDSIIGWCIQIEPPK